MRAWLDPKSPANAMVDLVGNLALVVWGADTAFNQNRLLDAFPLLAWLLYPAIGAMLIQAVLTIIHNRRGHAGAIPPEQSAERARQKSLFP
jgi:hypothetical protein